MIPHNRTQGKSACSLSASCCPSAGQLGKACLSLAATAPSCRQGFAPKRCSVALGLILLLHWHSMNCFNSRAKSLSLQLEKWSLTYADSVVFSPACSWSFVLPSNTDAWHWGYYTDNFLDPAADPEKWGAAPATGLPWPVQHLMLKNNVSGDCT